jgi:hypothetical protein
MKQVIDGTVYDTHGPDTVRICYGNCGGVAYQYHFSDSLYRMGDGSYVVDRYVGTHPNGRILVRVSEAQAKKYAEVNCEPDEYFKAFPASPSPISLREAARNAIEALEQAPQVGEVYDAGQALRQLSAIVDLKLALGELTSTSPSPLPTPRRVGSDSGPDSDFEG